MTGRGFASQQAATGLVIGAVAIAVVSTAIAALRQVVPSLGLTSLYLFAILPVAILSGYWAAGIVAVASYLTFEFFFAPPLYSFAIARRDTAAALVVSLVTAYLVSELARRAVARAHEARLSAKEAEQAQKELRRLAVEQAALRRVATLVAREAPAEELFAKVAEEVVLLLGAEAALIQRYEPAGDAIVVANSGTPGDTFPVGGRVKLEGNGVTALVYRTQRPARFVDRENATGADARRAGLGSAVASPIVVDRRLWGAIVATTSGTESLPADAELRIAKFTELVTTAISNIQARSDLAASRARIVATADAERRRVVRDLHDGAQQSLVQTILMLKLARSALEGDGQDAAALVDDALQNAETATGELRELVHGILPSVLIHGGLRAAVKALASRMSIPVEMDISVARLPRAVEASAYFIVAEALTNVAKHSHADRATVRAHLETGTLQVEVRDDGVGGARPGGSGLVGLSDRLAALDGTLRVQSPADGGTLISASIPVRQ
jgi:signal transduction histidine kinase